MTATVREFSPAGPCLMLGALVKRTAKTITFTDRSDGTVQRRGGWKVQERDGRRGYIHTEPCHSCRDHIKTQYPNGYMD